jgi:hypothetical protein
MDESQAKQRYLIRHPEYSHLYFYRGVYYTNSKKRLFKPGWVELDKASLFQGFEIDAELANVRQRFGNFNYPVCVVEFYPVEIQIREPVHGNFRKQVDSQPQYQPTANAIRCRRYKARQKGRQQIQQGQQLDKFKAPVNLTPKHFTLPEPQPANTDAGPDAEAEPDADG